MSFLAKRLRLCGVHQAVPYADVVLADVPYAYWPLTDTSGAVASDLSGHQRDGVYQAAVQLRSGELPPGIGDAYVRLTGDTASYVDVSAATEFCAGPGWSAECWSNVSAWTVSGADGSHGTPWGTNTGARFLGNQTWKGGSIAQSGIDWDIEAYAGGGRRTT
ncbi:hypothetical protein AWB71_04310 [Caballeronia peredens]|nr:hypothetical protein AWB71_04310 [Caballeronia peredens]